MTPFESGGGAGLVVTFHEAEAPPADGQDQAAYEADRAIVLAVMHDVRPEPSIEATALSLCEAVARIDGIDGAMIMVVPETGDLVHVTSVGPPLPGFELGARVPIENLESLIQMTSAGSWSLDFADPTTGQLLGVELFDSIRAAGISATAYVGIRQGEELVGVLCLAAQTPDGVTKLRRKMDALEQIAAFAGMVLANQAILFGQRETMRARVRAMIQRRGFVTLVQPIVSLSSGAIEGFEALTRFDDGRSPDVWFADAHAVGLGIELEEACAVSALFAMGDEHAETWLAINFSPVAVIGGVVARLDIPSGRKLVVEITEHSAIEEYEELRAAMARLPGVDISIDDAGAGFSSLRHILELAPAYVKLDIGLVRDVDVDLARAAMVAGMVHFARVTGTRLIAEGIETLDESITLANLGVDLGQGYHFHRPGPVDSFVV